MLLASYERSVELGSTDGRSDGKRLFNFFPLPCTVSRRVRDVGAISSQAQLLPDSNSSCCCQLLLWFDGICHWRSITCITSARLFSFFLFTIYTANFFFDSAFSFALVSLCFFFPRLIHFCINRFNSSLVLSNVTPFHAHTAASSYCILVIDRAHKVFLQIIISVIVSGYNLQHGNERTFSFLVGIQYTEFFGTT